MACVLDSFTGALQHVLGSHRGAAGATGDVMDASYSPCGGFVVAGTAAGHVAAWNTVSGREEALFKGARC